MESAKGNTAFTEKEITGTIVEYFKNLFKTAPGDRRQIVTEALTTKSRQKQIKKL